MPRRPRSVELDDALPDPATTPDKAAERDEARAEIPEKTAAESLQRLVRKLDRAARKLGGLEDAQTRRAWRWALDARVSRRALALRQAIDRAGSVYLPDRLHAHQQNGKGRRRRP